jgi:hypothetical protein
MRPSVLIFSLALTFGVPFTTADEVSNEERCVEAIFEAYTHLSFTGSHSQPFLVNSCLNPLRTWSIYASVKVRCGPLEIDPGLRHINESCRKGGLSRTPYADIAPSLTEEYIRSLRVVDYEEVPKAVELDAPVLISRAYYDAAFRTNVSQRGIAFLRKIEWSDDRVGSLVPGLTHASFIWVRTPFPEKSREGEVLTVWFTVQRPITSGAVCSLSGLSTISSPICFTCTGLAKRNIQNTLHTFQEISSSNVLQQYITGSERTSSFPRLLGLTTRDSITTVRSRHAWRPCR